MRQPRTCGTTSRNTVAPNAAKCPEAAAWHHRTKGLLGDDFRRSVAVRTRTVGMLAKVPRHRPGGDRAVRDAILLLRGKLTDGPAADRLGCPFGQRVVAEPGLTAQGQRDPPPAPPRSRHHESPAALAAAMRVGWVEIRENADVMRCPPLRWDIPHGTEELRVVLIVGRVLAGISPGAHARFATQGVHLEPRIVGQGGHAGDACVKASLEDRVASEGARVLDRL